MPVSQCFGGGFLFAEQPEWTRREYVKEMTIRKTMIVKRVQTEGGECDCINNEDTLQTMISTIRAKCRCDLQGTRAETYVGFEIDQWSPAKRLLSLGLDPAFFLDVSQSRPRIPPARRRLQNQDASY